MSPRHIAIQPLFLLFALILAVPPARGQSDAPDAAELDPPPAPQTMVLPPVVVVADGHESQAFTSARAVTVIDAETLALRAPRTTPEALSHAPGIFVQKTNHGAGTPIIRGLLGPQNLILIDGVRFNNAVHRTGPNQYLNLVDPFFIERIEVLRGPGSVRYGSDAMGGVIAITPAALREHSQAGQEFSAEALLRSASADLERSGHVKLGYEADAFAARAGATLRSFADLDGGRGVGLQPYSSYQSLSAAARLGYAIAGGPLDQWRAEATTLFTRMDDAGRADQLASRHTLHFYDNQSHLSWVRLGGPLPSDSEVSLTVSHQYFWEEKRSQRRDASHQNLVSATRDEVGVHSLGLVLAGHSQPWTPLRLHGGVDFYHDWVGAQRWQRQESPPWRALVETPYPDGSTFASTGAHVNATVALLDPASIHHLEVQGGLRLQHIGGGAPANGALRANTWDHLGWVGMASLDYAYADRFNTALSFSQGFRAPNLNEAVGLGDDGKIFHIPNPELGPERSDTFELLSRLRLGPLALEASGYVTLLQDFIRREPATWQGLEEVAGKPVERNTNADAAQVWGAEGQALLEVGLGLHLSGSLTYTWGESESDGTRTPLTRIPPIFGAVSLGYRTPAQWPWRARCETSLHFAGPQRRLSPDDLRDPRIPLGGTPGWAVWNLQASVAPLPYLQVALQVENLLNARFKTHGSGLYGPGTNAVLSVSGRY